MKYKKEIDKLLRELYYDETTMTEEDYKEFIAEIEGIDQLKQEISNRLQVGETNGISVEHQLSMYKIMFKIMYEKFDELLLENSDVGCNQKG